LRSDLFLPIRINPPKEFAMPDTELIDALGQVRESYTQKQRAANGLLAGIKNVSGTLSKLGRALDDFSGQNTELDMTHLAGAADSLQRISQAKEQAIDGLLPDLRREAKQLAALTGALRDAISALGVDPVDVVRLDHAYAILQKNVRQDGGLDEILPRLTAALKEAEAQLGNVFGEALRDAMAESGVEVTGQPPRFEIGRFELNANFLNRKASLSYGKWEVARNISVSLDAVIKTYEREARSIEGRSVDGTGWIQQFYEAWEVVNRKNSKTTGRVNIVDCYFEMSLLRQNRAFKNEPSKRSFADYSRAQFTYDFVEFTQRQHLVYNGMIAQMHVATKSQTDSPGKSLWVVTGNSPHDGQYVGDVEFIAER
jgi:hypothetical protein